MSINHAQKIIYFELCFVKIVHKICKIVLHILEKDDNIIFVAKETTLWGSCFSNVLGVIRMWKDIFCGDKGCLFSEPKQETIMKNGLYFMGIYNCFLSFLMSVFWDSRSRKIHSDQPGRRLLWLYEKKQWPLS